MTDAEKNLAVAEACELPVYYYCGNPQPYLIDAQGVIGDRYDPLHNANQAIEALSKLGPWDWNYEHSMGLASILIYGGVGVGELEGRSTDPDPVRAFCLAAVDAILAAGGE